MFRAAFPRISPSSVTSCPVTSQCSSEMRLPKTCMPENGEACCSLPVTLDPMGRFAREGRQMCSLIRGSLHQATEEATPQCRARRERMARHRALPHGRLICNRRRRCFDPVPVTGAVHLGASSCQQPGSPRSGRRQNSRSGLSEAYGTVAAAEWGDPGCVADTGFSRYLAGEGRMVLRLIVINVAQGREAGA